MSCFVGSRAVRVAARGMPPSYKAELVGTTIGHSLSMAAGMAALQTTTTYCVFASSRSYSAALTYCRDPAGIEAVSVSLQVVSVCSCQLGSLSAELCCLPSPDFTDPTVLALTSPTQLCLRLCIQRQAGVTEELFLREAAVADQRCKCTPAPPGPYCDVYYPTLAGVPLLVHITL